MNIEYIENNIKSLNSLKNMGNIHEEILKEVIACFNRGNKLIFIGNGGSAADASHIACEFVSNNKLFKKGLPAISLTDSSSLSTSIGNDFEFNSIFKKQLEVFGTKGDILFGLTTSGKSSNVIEALDYARENNIKTVLVTGENIKGNYDYIVNIASNTTSIIQNMYIIFFHMLCLDLGKYLDEDRN